MKLPQEIIDIILLHLPFDTLKRTRGIQTKFVMYTTFHQSIYTAAKFRNKKNLIWLLNKKYPLDSVLFERVIYTHDLEMLKILRGYGCPWDENAIICAISHYRMDIVEWLVKSGCPYTRKSIRYAKSTKNKEALDLLSVNLK